MLARDKGNFHVQGENLTRDPPVQWLEHSEGHEYDSCPGYKNFRCPGRAWFLLPSKLKMFTGSVCVLLPSVSLKLIKIKTKLIYATTSL